MLKKLFKNQRGFTLVELLAVVVILGIIAAIAVPSIGNVIENSKEKADEANQEMFEEAARLAYANDLALQDVGSAEKGYKLGLLQSSGYLDFELPSENPNPNADAAETEYHSDDYVTITNGTFEFNNVDNS